MTPPECVWDMVAFMTHIYDWQPHGFYRWQQSPLQWVGIIAVQR